MLNLNNYYQHQLSEFLGCFLYFFKYLSMICCLRFLNKSFAIFLKSSNKGKNFSNLLRKWYKINWNIIKCIMIASTDKEQKEASIYPIRMVTASITSECQCVIVDGGWWKWRNWKKNCVIHKHTHIYIESTRGQDATSLCLFVPRQHPISLLELWWLLVCIWAGTGIAGTETHNRTENSAAECSCLMSVCIRRCFSKEYFEMCEFKRWYRKQNRDYREHRTERMRIDETRRDETRRRRPSRAFIVFSKNENEMKAFYLT